MKKIYPLLLVILLYINNFINNSYGMSFTQERVRPVMGGALPPRGFYGKCYMENYILYFIYPVITLLGLYFIFIAPYRFYKRYKKMSVEEKSKILIPIIISNLIRKGVLGVLLIWFLVIIYLIKDGNLNTPNDFWVTESLIGKLILFIFINSLATFLFEIIYGFLHLKKNCILSRKIIKESTIRYIISTIILFGISIGIMLLINYLGN